MDYKFKDDFVADRLFELNQVEGINEHTMTGEAMSEIRWILRLDYWGDCEDLRAIRNSVVVIYGAFMETRKYLTIMSAITSVIDSTMIERFGHD